MDFADFADDIDGNSWQFTVGALHRSEHYLFAFTTEYLCVYRYVYREFLGIHIQLSFIFLRKVKNTL